MTVALVCRTAFVAVWLLALLTNVAREPLALVPAIALLGVWAAPLVRDGGPGHRRTAGRGVGRSARA